MKGFVFLLNLYLVFALSNAAYAEDISQSGRAAKQDIRSVYAQCNIPFPGFAEHPVFKNLTRIRLILMDAGPWDCKGQEGVCADKNAAFKFFPEKKAKWIEDLKQTEKAYPDALNPEKLKPLFLKRINEAIYPFVVPTTDCQRPPVDILSEDEITKSSSWGPHEPEKINTWDRYGPDILVIVVQISFQTHPEPPIAILSSSFYRPGMKDFTFDTQIFQRSAMAIPLNLSDEEIDKRLSMFVNFIRD